MKVSNFQFWKGAMIAMAAVVVAAGLFSAGIAHADMASSTNCTLSASDFEHALQNGSISYNTIALTSSTASITITNNTGCNAPINLASYQMYVAQFQPQWLSTQQFLNAASSSIAAGSSQTLTVPVASCMTQVDAYYGVAPTSLLNSNPYGYPNVPFVFTWAFTPTNLCSVTPPPTPTSTTMSATVNLGGVEDLATTSTIENNGDYNDVVFGFSSSSAVTAISQNGSLSPLTSSVVNESGTVYWDNLSLDGSQYNVGYCVLGNGNCTLAGGPFTNQQYLAGSNGAQVNNMTFAASGTVTMELLGHIASYSDVIGWYDPTNPSVLHPIISTPVATGTSATFTPSPVFGLYLDNGNGSIFYSENASDTTDGTIQHFAMFNVGFSTPTSTPTSTPSTNADIAITKTVDDATPSEGDTVNYTLTVSALGPATSTGVVATDTLPSGLTFENATASVGTYATSTGTWTIGDLAASSTATLDIAAQIASGTAGQAITNTAIVGESASSTDTNLTNNSSTATITVQSNGCTSNCGGGGGGTPATSTLTVIVSGLNASDTAALSVADLTASTTQATSTGNGSSTFVLATNDQYVVTATTTAVNASGTYAEATSTGCAGTLATATTCNVTFTFTPTPTSTIPSTDADISVTKTVDNANPNPGDNVTYTVTVADAGPATSTNVSAQDILPGGLSLVSATTSVGTYDMSTGDWTIGNVAPNATATLTIVANVAGNTAGQTITNTATVTQLSSIVDQNPSNNSSSVSIAVQSPSNGGGCTSNCGGGGGGGGGGEQTAQLQVAKTVDNANPNPGDTIHYTVTVSALGPSESVGVVASDTLPAGVTFVSASSSVGTYDNTTGSWNIGNIVEGTSQTLVITATVDSTDPIGETITNTATTQESTNVNNPLAADNTANVTITVGGSNGGGGGNGGGQVLGASASCGIYLDQYIHPIRKNLNDPTEVIKLQKFLNMNLGTSLPLTGYYGPETIAAVDQFQVKYHIEVLQPWLNYGLPTEYTPTDYVYKTTQRWINLIMCSSLNLPVPQLP